MADIATLAGLVAHQGGWDEVLLVGAPILLIVGLLAVAKRRVDAHDAVAVDVPGDVPGDDDHDE